jgi:uncharacterized protein YjbI with pentapeptide repeats
MVKALLRCVTMKGCKADFANLHEAKLDRVDFTDCILTEAALEALNARQLTFDSCDLTRASLFRTPMKGIDMTTCTLDGILVNLPDLRGMIVSPTQAMNLAKLLGLVVK